MSVPLVLISFALFGVSGKFFQKCVYRYSKFESLFFHVFLWTVGGERAVDGGLWNVWGVFFFDWYFFFYLNFSFGKTQQKTKIVWACTKFNWFGVYNDVLFLFAIDEIHFGHL